MLKYKKPMLIIGVIVLAAITWILAASSSARASQKQLSLVKQAQEYIEDKIYVKAVPLLEEALNASKKNQELILPIMASTYIEMGKSNQYIATLQTMIKADVADETVYLAAAQNLLKKSEYIKALELLKQGITKLNSPELLVDFYEGIRYQFTVGFDKYEEMQAARGGFLTVKLGEKWGTMASSGNLKIAPVFDKLNPFYMGYATAIQDGEIIEVDKSGNRVALCKKAATDVVSLSENLTALLVDGKWHFANPSFEIYSEAYDFIGTAANGIIPVCKDGKWGLMSGASKSVTDFIFDGIALNEDLSAYANGRFFAKTGDKYYLYDKAGKKISETGYDDAKPFLGTDGLAAVKSGEKWGFVDKAGEVKIDFAYDDAFSFSCGVAAARKDEMWGYISVFDKEAIEFKYLDAKPFSGGVAPVYLDKGWFTITLKSYDIGGGGLF